MNKYYSLNMYWKNSKMTFYSWEVKIVNKDTMFHKAQKLKKAFEMSKYPVLNLEVNGIWQWQEKQSSEAFPCFCFNKQIIKAK